jgi:hypothetical protein
MFDVLARLAQAVQRLFSGRILRRVVATGTCLPAFQANPLQPPLRLKISL